MIYQLELRQQGAWNQVRASSDLSYVQKFKDAVFDRAHHTGWRIFDSARKRLKNGELAGAPKPASRRASPGVVDVQRQAKLAAEHIRSTKRKGVHVFPLGKGHAHTSNQFRKYLFGELTGRTGWLDDRDRVKAEAAAERLGYIIIEVNPDDWSTS